MWRNFTCVSGDGMNAYMAYKVTTKVGFTFNLLSWYRVIKSFKRKESSLNRTFICQIHKDEECVKLNQNWLKRDALSCVELQQKGFLLGTVAISGHLSDFWVSALYLLSCDLSWILTPVCYTSCLFVVRCLFHFCCRLTIMLLVQICKINLNRFACTCFR